MKNLMLTLGLLGWMTISSWAQNDYLQWETHRYYAKPGQAENFEKGLAAHNKKFHSAAPYKTSIFHVRTGPNSGCYELVMGPMTFTQMEGRPTGDDHDNDWEKMSWPMLNPSEKPSTGELTKTSNTTPQVPRLMIPSAGGTTTSFQGRQTAMKK